MPSVPNVVYSLVASKVGGPAEDESPSPPRLVKTAGSEFVELAVLEAVPDAVVDELVLLAGVGSKAPQGWSCRQSPAQSLSEPQAFTHWLPHSWQTKYGSVKEYSETLGVLPSLQRHP